MYKAFIEPDLQTAHIKIINKFNPFTGFQNPTYILKVTICYILSYSNFLYRFQVSSWRYITLIVSTVLVSKSCDSGSNQGSYCCRVYWNQRGNIWHLSSTPRRRPWSMSILFENEKPGWKIQSYVWG